MGWTGGYVLLALLIAPYLRKFGKYTIPDFVGDRYYSNVARMVAIVCVLFVSFTYVAGQMRGVGIVFSRFLEVEITTGVLIGMGIVFFYAVLGGMKGITYTQVAQYCVLIFAFLVPAIFISMQMTGNPVPQLGFGSTLTDGSNTYLLDKLDQLSIELGFGAYTEGKKSTIDRNRASADDNFISSVLSSLKSTPVAKNEEPSNFHRQFPKLKGMIRRGEDRRHGDRRNRPSESSAPSFQAGEPDYVVSLSDSAKKIFREHESSDILN